jgi:hypothetical protein
MLELLTAGVICLATMTQTLTGFGSALVAMSILPGLLSLQIAAPLMALLSLCISITLSLVYRRQFQLGVVARLAIASLPMVPVGIVLLRYLPERLLLIALSLVICSYALYALFKFRLPHFQSDIWAYGFGACSGILSGAYNTGGPPVVIYGNCRRWPPEVFKSNLSSFFLLNALTVNLGHAVQGNFTREVWQYVPGGLAGFATGAIAGLVLSRYLQPALFQKGVLILLLVSGVKMLF